MSLKRFWMRTANANGAARAGEGTKERVGIGNKPRPREKDSFWV